MEALDTAIAWHAPRPPPAPTTALEFSQRFLSTPQALHALGNILLFVNEDSLNGSELRVFNELDDALDDLLTDHLIGEDWHLKDPLV